MELNKTAFPFLEEDCIRQFGEETGRRLLAQAEAAYQALLGETGRYRDAAVREHLRGKLLPMMAYYQALRAAGTDQGEALDYVRKETRRAAAAQKEKMKSLGRLPFAYTLFRLGAKKHMKKNFPPEGWATEWVRCDGREIHFDLHRCIYRELTKRCGCPELCRVYCENDNLVFSGLLPGIRFARAGTLGDGAPCCDFHFFKGR